MSAVWLEKFVEESNRIEGIVRRPTVAEVQAHNQFLEVTPTVESLEALVSVCAPGHRLRDKPGLNVRVGNHFPPQGGKQIRKQLEVILTNAVNGDPHAVHVRYENLHPFTDGNGRSGRALWLWMMVNNEHCNELMATELGFLHSFYYQTLSASDARQAT